MTAVEQFIEQLEEQGDSWENVSIGRIQISIKVEDYLELQRQAKEMEHEQMEFFYKQGHLNSGCPYALEEVYLKRFEDESNETFKSE